MFCLRSWLPLLFIPTNASPAFIFLFFVCTYFLNRPCVYCSFLLLILFLTSCNWSDRCLFDIHANWFEARPGSTSYITSMPAHAIVEWAKDVVGAGASGALNGTAATSAGAAAAAAVNLSTAGTAGTAALDDLNATTSAVVVEMLNTTMGALVNATAEQMTRATRVEWTGLGLEWLRSLLGKREWRVECLDLYIRL